jgi:3-deoxy-D-manno-octulosonic-acid transferase
MQTEEDARRIIAIGAPPSRVHVARNLKYDIPVSTPTPGQRAELRSRYHLSCEVPVVTAGSTHQGEEEEILDAFRELGRRGKQFVLILVPRHPERVAEVSALMDRAGLVCVRRSTLDGHAGLIRSGEVLLVDTVGELLGLYSLSELVFVGGSLVPVGGHNILEPASLGIPVLFGPHMQNFREIASGILECGGGVRVEDAAELTRCMEELLDSPAKRDEMGRKGAALLAANSGSTRRHMEIIEALATDAQSP